MAAKKPFPLRIDPDLYEDLRRWAEAEFRSVNGQIEYLLRDAVDRRFGRKAGRADEPSRSMPAAPEESDPGTEGHETRPPKRGTGASGRGGGA